MAKKDDPKFSFVGEIKSILEDSSRPVVVLLLDNQLSSASLKTGPFWKFARAV